MFYFHMLEALRCMTENMLIRFTGSKLETYQDNLFFIYYLDYDFEKK